MLPLPELSANIRALGKDITLRDADELRARDAGSDPANFAAGLMALPGDVDALAALVALCARLRVPVVPQGGRTGLVGGTASGEGMLLVSTERLNRIEDVDAASRTALVEAGVTLEALQRAAAAHGLEPGIDLGARGTATIGGMVSTNAGGIQAFRHGVMRHRVLGLEVVLADGRVLSDLTRVVKATTGYDVKQMFIGAEGTLGIVSRVVVKLGSLPAARATALVALPDAASALSVAAHFMARPGTELLACEIMSRGFLNMNAAAQETALAEGFASAPFSLLLDIDGASAGEAERALSEGLAEIWDAAGIREAVVAQSLQQAGRLWHLREDMSVFARLYPGHLSFDVSIPPSAIDAYCRGLRETLARVEPGLSPLIFGHIADGNLHVIPRRGNYDPDTRRRVEDAVCAGIEAIGGAVSAEHGIGAAKLGLYERFVSPQKRELVAAIKAMLDPHGLFNPGKIVRSEDRHGRAA